MYDHINSTFDVYFAADNILLVGHASNIDTNTRQLVGRRPLIKSEMTVLMQDIPYSCMITCERSEEDNKWRIVPPYAYPVSHNKNPRFDWSRVANYNPDA